MKFSLARLFLVIFLLIEALGTLLLSALNHVSRDSPQESANASFVRQIANVVTQFDKDVALLAEQPATAACLEKPDIPGLCQSHAAEMLAYHPGYSLRFLSRQGQEIVVFATENTPMVKEQERDFKLAAGLNLQTSHVVKNADGTVVGQLIVGQATSELTALFENLPRGTGYAELRQYEPGGGYGVLLRKGNEELGQGAPSVLAEIAHSPWKVALYAASSGARVMGLPAFFATWLVFTLMTSIIMGLAYWALHKHVQGDLGTLIGMVSDIRRSRLQSDYSVRLDDFEHSLNILKKLGRLMVGKHLEVTAQATLDHLSQVHNRRSFEAKQREIFKTLSVGFPHTLLLMDIDRFKHVNDTYGHDAGDRLIVEFGKALKENLRASDFIARLGGDEFCIIFPNTPLKQAAELAERLRQKMPKYVVLGTGIRHELRYSAGLTAYDRNDRTETAALARADTALLDAKRAGRNVTQVKAA
jgi:diguanylate cyclase (GGDEF)-like protein